MKPRFVSHPAHVRDTLNRYHRSLQQLADTDRISAAAQQAGDHLAQSAKDMLRGTKHSDIDVQVWHDSRTDNVHFGVPADHEHRQRAEDMEYGNLDDAPQAVFRRTLRTQGPEARRIFHRAMRQGPNAG